MKLPNDEIGVSDIIDHGECPRRFEFKMHRHTPAGEKPEAKGPSNAYGTAVHDAISYIDANGSTVDEAVQHAFDRHNGWLDPDDLLMLKEDMAVYQSRLPSGVRTVVNEGEMRMPLFEHEGRQVYFRARIDRLYQRLDRPETFIHVDYKSGKWEKTEPEVHKDKQLWAYNLMLHEQYPEIETLVQVYDQLRHGTIPTRKSAAQREQIKEWLIKQATAVLRDTDLDPKFNEWCPWCPILESCSVIRNLSEFASSRLVALAPQRKIGRSTIVDLDPMLLEVYVEPLADVHRAKQVLDRYEKAVKDAIKNAPQGVRERLGYKLTSRRNEFYTPEGLKAAHELLGDQFYEVVKMSKTAVTDSVEDERLRDMILGYAESAVGATSVRKA